MRTIFIIIIIAFAIQQDVLGQDNEKKELLERVEKLEKRNLNLDEDLKKLSVKVQESDTKNNELENSFKDYEPLLKNINWILSGFGVGTLLALLFAFLVYFPKKVNQRIDDEITRILTDRKSDFVELLKDFDFEQKAKQKFRIKLLTHSNGNDSFIYNLLIKNGFNVSSDTKLEKLESNNIEENDIIFINNEGGEWQVELIQEFIKKTKNYFFYFGKGVIQLPDKEQSRFAAANIRTQFIGNLLNLIKYN